MNITDYLLNQSSQVKSQLEKNHKIVNESILLKTHNSFKLSKDKNKPILNNNHSHKKEKNNIKEILKQENSYFIQLYAKTKKLYPTKVEETFKDLICQYQNNDYKIPDLSDKKNLFNQNPLLLVGRDLDQFYMYNNKHKNSNDKLKRKHINFIKKEMLFMEKIINKNNEIKKKSKSNIYGNNNNNNNNTNNINDFDDDINYKNEKINYFMVDSVWDKIKNQKLKEKNMIEQQKMLKRKKKLVTSLKKNRKNKNYIINISEDKPKDLIDNKNKTNNKFNVIDSYSTFYKNNKSLKTSNEFSNLKSLNSINTIKSNKSLKDMKSNEAIPLHISYNESSIKKLKHNLLNINLFAQNEESNKLQKEIEDIKNTLNNSNLIEKNIIMEKKPFKSFRRGTISYDKNNKSLNNYTIPSFSFKNNFPLLLNNNNNEQNENNNRNKKKLTIQVRSTPEKKDNDLPDKKFSLKIFELIKKRTIPFLSMNKLLKEKDPQKFLELLKKVDLKIFNRKEIEKLMKNYCSRVLGYNEKETERIININKNDENIYRIIENIIQKTKKNTVRYYGKYNLRANLEEVNNTIFNLKKKFILGKTDYNYDQ